MFDWWWKLLYNISEWINGCIDSLYKLFLFLAGAAPADVSQEIAGDSNSNILVSVFTDNSISMLFMVFLSFSAMVFAISIIIGLVRSEWASKDNGEGKVKVLKQSLKGFLTIFLIPTVFSIGIWAVSILLSTIVSSVPGSATGDFSLAQKLFEICLPQNSSALDMPHWTMGYDDLISLGWDLQSYNYFLAYAGGIIILLIIGLAALNLVERIIDLVFLYLVSPFIIAVSPLDDGNRLGIWKDLVIAKLLSVAGMIICFYIYFLCLPIVSQIFAGDSFIVKLGYLIFAIGGALAARKGGLLISNLVGHNTALIEGQQAGQTAQIVGTGFRAGLGVISTLAGGAIHLLKGHGGADKTAKAASNISDVASSAGAVAADTGTQVSSILQNNAATTFAGIQAADQATRTATPEAVPNNIGSELSGTQTVPEQPSTTAAAPSQTINNGQGFTAAAPQVDVPAQTVEAPSSSDKTVMPADMEIRNALNENGFNNNGSDKDK